MRRRGWQFEREMGRESERERELAIPRGRATQKRKQGCSLGLRSVIVSFGKELPLVGNTRPTLLISSEPNPRPSPLRRRAERNIQGANT